MAYFKIQMKEEFTKTFIVKAEDEEQARDLLEMRFNDDELNCTDDIEGYDREVVECEKVSKKSVIGKTAITEYNEEKNTDSEIVR